MDLYTYSGERLEVDYYPTFLTEEEADTLYEELLPLFKDRKITPGKRISTTVGDPGVSYSFHMRGKEISRSAEGWHPSVLKYKKRVEEFTGAIYNYAVVQYYPTGKAWIQPHCDKEMRRGCDIAGLSLGAKRVLSLGPPHYNTKHKTPLEIELENGSLYVLKNPSKNCWSHSIIKDESIKEARISITYRLA